MTKGKISIIGAGNVGSTIAYTIALSGMFSEICIVDKNINKAQGDAMDIQHGISFISPVTVVSGDYEIIKNSDLIVIAAGANQNIGETRIDLLKRNTSIFKEIIGEILKFCDNNTILLVVSNPVDILTHITLKLSGFDKTKVIGSGTVLDTSRLKYMIGENLGIDIRNVHSFIIGEHGDTEVPAWSLTSVSGMNIQEFCESLNDNKYCLNKEQLYEKTKNAAYEIIDKKGATYYAVALAVRKILEVIIGDENSILTVSNYLDGEYGINDICLSIPTIVNKNGIKKVIEVPLSDNELKLLRHSADTLKSLVREIGI